MKTVRFLFGILLIFALTSSQAWAAERLSRPVTPGQSDKCPVCGMFVAKYKKWVAEIIFKDGSYAVFDGTVDMFKYYFNLSRYNPSKTKADIASVYATEYYTTAMKDARELLYIQGSDVYGPMGAELIPVSGKEAAEEFLKDHKGKKVLRFEEITPGHLK